MPYEHLINFPKAAALEIPHTEGIKYAGSKLKMIPYIMRAIVPFTDIKTVLDGFSGTTRVAQAFAQLGYDTTANDISVWSEVFGKCYLLSQKPDAFYQKILDHLNVLPGKNGWFSEHYGGLETGKKPFQLKNTQKLDAVRDEIEKLNLEDTDKSVILTSLILALDSVDNTLGHYASYLAGWSARSHKELFLRLPKRFPILTQNRVIKDDIFNTVKNNVYDLVYFDPPYGSNNEKMPPSRVRYNAYYHLWTSVILNDKPDVFGKANRRADSKDTASPSVFESFKKSTRGHFVAMEALEQLIMRTQAHYVVLSYSSGGRATKQDLLDILTSNGKLTAMLEIDYKKNVMSKMTWTNQWINTPCPHREYLFVLEK